MKFDQIKLDRIMYIRCEDVQDNENERRAAVESQSIECLHVTTFSVVYI